MAIICCTIINYNAFSKYSAIYFVDLMNDKIILFNNNNACSNQAGNNAANKITFWNKCARQHLVEAQYSIKAQAKNGL